MIKQLHFKWMLLLCALMVGTNVAWAAEITTFVASDYNGGTTNSWTVNNPSYQTAGGGYYLLGYNTANIVSPSITWANYTDIKIKITARTYGGPSNDQKKISVMQGDTELTSYSPGSTSLTASSALSISPTSGALTIVCSGASSNKGSGISKIEITGTLVATTPPTITFNNGSVNVGKTLNLSSLFTSNSAGAVTYSITEGDTYASISGDILTGIAVGSVTVKASQAAAGAYGTGEATATILVNAALTLNSIAVTTPPTKTTYTEGETFDATGMVVTATYSDASTDDVTASCTFTPSGALATSDTEITISYTENAVEKTTTQAITVNPYVQPTTVTIQMTNSLFGEEVHTSGKADTNMNFVGNQDNVTVTYFVPENSYYYFNTSNTRPYDTCTLTYGAPDGYAITRIVFTSDGNNWNAATPSVGSMTETKQWDGFAGSVTFSWETSGTRIKTVVVTLANTQTVGITAVGLATFVTDAPLDYTSVDGIEAYIATTDGSTISLAKKNKVPANTGVLLRATAGGTSFVVPVATSATDDVTGNLFVRGAGMAVASSEAGYHNYILNNVGGVLGFYRAAGNTVAKNRAYLHTMLDANAVALDFDNVEDMTTGIDNIEHSTLNIEHSEFYNLNGQRVAQPTKGLYIVNGRKVVVK